VDNSTEYPELEAWKSTLEHQYYQAQSQWNDSVYAGKPDATAQQWEITTRHKLDEANRALRNLARFHGDKESTASTKIGVPTHIAFIFATLWIMTIVVLAYIALTG